VSGRGIYWGTKPRGAKNAGGLSVERKRKGGKARGSSVSQNTRLWVKKRIIEGVRKKTVDVKREGQKRSSRKEYFCRSVWAKKGVGGDG